MNRNDASRRIRGGALKDSREKEIVWQFEIRRMKIGRKRGGWKRTVGKAHSFTCWILLQPDIKGQLICLRPWRLQTGQVLWLTHTHTAQSCHTLLLHETSLTCQTAMMFKSLLISLEFVTLRVVTLVGIASYHWAEGISKEDCVSVQKSLVSAALSCLQYAQTHTYAQKKVSYMSATAPDSGPSGLPL